MIRIVNTTHQSILSDDVLKALGEERNPEGYYAKRVKFSLSQQTDEEYNLAVRTGDMEKAQEKSAEAAVYTDDGGLIPLSQRFKENKRDIRYSLTPTEKAQRAQERAETAAAKAEEAKQAAQESYKRELTGGLKKLFEVQSYDFELFQRCQREGVGISVMKPFFAGRLLSADQSPFGAALTRSQCLQYAIDRPGVLVVVPGVQTMEHLDQILEFLTATDEEKDYSVIGTFTADTVTGTCVYCNHCQPCPAGIDIGLVNKYYDLALAGDTIAANHYTKLSVNADACLHCGHCESRCPFGVKQESRMETIARYFG